MAPAHGPLESALRLVAATMMRHRLVLVLTAVVSLGVAGCASSNTPTEDAVRSFSFTDVSDWTSSDYFTIGTPIAGISDQFGDRLTVPLVISHFNQIIINPKATVTFADGTKVTCQEEDLRRLPSLVESRTDVDLPCDGTFPDDADDAHIVIVDEYH